MSATVSKTAAKSGSQTILVVPFPPGGSTDFTARVLAQRLEVVFDHPVVVETRAGDDGLDAIRRLMQGPEDRMFLVGNVNANSVLPVVRQQSIDFDYANAVLPISRLAEFPSVMMTHTAFPADTLGDFLGHLKNTTGRMRYGTDFLGTYVDYDAIMLGRAAGLDVAYLATSGAVGILQELQAGNSDLAMLNVATANANKGKYKPLAVTGPDRLKNFPQVPTMAEAGFPGIGTSNWQGLFASRRASKDVTMGLYDVVVQVMDLPEMRGAFSDIDARAVTSSSPEDFAREIESEMREWKNTLAAILALPRADEAA